jgi:SagB-type dehydrogenase family enzyme
VDRAQDLRIGLQLTSFGSRRRKTDKEIDLLVRRLAWHRLLEYRIGSSEDEHVVIEPQVTDYWPRTGLVGDADILVLSRFAYMRRRGNEMVLESPLAGALFRICNPKIATALAALSSPQKIKQLRRLDGFPGVELLGLLVDCQILLKADASLGADRRLAEGDSNLVLWDFHDLLFHTRSTEGRHANPLGGLYLHAGVLPVPRAIRPSWPGKQIDLRNLSAAQSGVAKLLRERHSIRSFDDRRPITLAELARLLDGTARVVSKRTSKVGLSEDSPEVEYTVRPYPSAGASYELELYLAVHRCEGLAGGFYHYDAGQHALVLIETRPDDLQALLTGASFAMDAPVAPQVLVTIAARFDRVSWKYSSLAYALIQKDVGVMLQALYLMTADIGLGGCAIGTANIDLFAKMTGIKFHVEGPVGQFALGRVAA